MAADSVLSSIGDLLSTELWTLILKEVRISLVLPPEQLQEDLLTLQLSVISNLSWGLRFVCRRFNDILTPLLYHQIRLPDSMVSDEETPTCCQVKANIRAHARRIVIDQSMNWDEVSKLICGSRFLKDLE